MNLRNFIHQCDYKVIDSIENNIRNKMEYVPSRLDEMFIRRVADAIVIGSTFPTDAFNSAYGGQLDTAVVKSVSDVYREKQQSMSWWIGPSSDNYIARAGLRECGFVCYEKNIGMACELDLVADNLVFDTELEIKKCKTIEEFKDFGDVLTEVFNPNDDKVKVFYEKLIDVVSKGDPSLSMYVGYIDGAPVTTAGLFFDEVAGIYEVATKGDYRCRGYGSAIFHKTLMEAKEKGFKLATLQASPKGLNIYKRFGFKEVCEFTVWGNRRSL